MIRVEVQEDDFDVGRECGLAGAHGGGAIASFVGQVRGEGDLTALHLEHYPAMTQDALRGIAAEADSKWSLHAITIIHRVGTLTIGENIVLVVTASDHRHAAMEACAYIMDKLKTVAPFWKKEINESGGGQWVEERATDIEAAKKWR